jgi:hypothetical protein
MTLRLPSISIVVALFFADCDRHAPDKMRLWNSAHLSDGCAAEAFRSTGGNGLFYRFAVE